MHNLPVVPPEKFDKLVNVVRKIYSQIGAIPEGASLRARHAPRHAASPACAFASLALTRLPRSAGGLWMPVDDASKQTKGYAFIEFANATEAQAALEQTDGYKLDKQHVFKARAAAAACALCARDAHASPSAASAALPKRAAAPTLTLV